MFQIFSGFMIGLYSFTVMDARIGSELIYHGTTVNLPGELCIIIYCFEIVFNAMLLYGVHKVLLILFLGVEVFREEAILTGCFGISVVLLILHPLSEDVRSILFRK